MIDEILAELCSLGYEWTDKNVIINLLRNHGFTDEEVKKILNFLVKYFLEVDESRGKIRPSKSLRKLYE
ncbi:hypothetical protein KEJ34_04075 [Candidatus Bathyarchaeota archaeon]|nr:hypothetical protein [Candidatus Bathyarchaeota archaeon]